MQSDRFLDSHKYNFNTSIKCKKKTKKVSTNNSNQYINLETSLSYYKNNYFKIFLLIGMIILTFIYSLNYYSFYFILKGFKYIVKKINHKGYVIRKVMIYLTMLLIIEIIVINLYLLLFNLIKKIINYTINQNNI